MNATVVQPGPNLRVAVVAQDPARAAELRAIVERAGHEVTEPNGADVALLHGSLSAGESIPTGKPVLILGSPDASRAGWLPADAGATQIDAALRAVAVGLSVRPSSDAVGDSDAIEPVGSAGRGFEELRERSPHSLLTPRELEVLTLVSVGSSNKAIARELGISLHTVKFHIESLFRKLGARTRAEAVAKALERRGRETIEI